MNKIIIFIIIGLFICMFTSCMNALAVKRIENTNRELSAKKRIEIKSTSGNVYIKKGSSDKIIVDVKASVKPDGAFKPEFIESKNTLELIERWGMGTSSGWVVWNLTVPEKTEIDFSSSSGSLTVEGLSNKINAASSSGSIKVSLGETAKYDISLSTSSGNVILVYNGNPLQGYYKLSAREDYGKIEAPVQFENINEGQKNNHSPHTFIEKSFSIDGDRPSIILHTASGKVVLKK